MSKEIQVVFEPSGRRVFVLPGTILMEATARAGFIIASPCGSVGKCGKCLVRIVKGNCPPSETELKVIKAHMVSDGFRLACQAAVREPLTVEIPEASLFEMQQRILEHGTGGPFAIRPGIMKQFVELPLPTHTDAVSDIDRLQRAVGSFRADVSVLRRIPRLLRDAHFRVTTVMAEGELLDVEPGDTSGECHGVAFDIGTTTIVGTAVDLHSGKDLDVASGVNPQTSYGDDVVSRISLCRDKETGLGVLQEAVMGRVRGIIDELVKESRIDRRTIYSVTVAGNTTMQQIFAGIDPSPLGEMPFVALSSGSVRMRAVDLGLNINPAAVIYIFPQIGGFVGGDTVAGVVASHLDELSEPTLLVDIGTNGELVLAHKGRMIATSVAAGPAFEGARIVSGMRASNGAIEEVVFNADVDVNVIGDAKPAGLCGTGLVDAVAGMLRAGVLDSTGRILSSDEAGPAVPESLRRRLVEHHGQIDFLMVDAERTANGEPLFLYQKDIRELQLANGAIRAGINILLRMEGLQAADLGVVLLAGAFGNFIRCKNARRIGMLPAIPSERIRFIGNAASFGAKSVLVSTAEREYAESVAAKIRHVDLSLDPEFQMEFGDAMLFPGAEADLV